MDEWLLMWRSAMHVLRRRAGATGAMQPDTLMLWLSAGKPLTAIAIAMLMERGQLSLDQSVASVIPEFAVNGKEVITLRHLLTHTAGTE